MKTPIALLLALTAAFPAYGEERGSRPIVMLEADLDKDRLVDKVLIREHAADDGNVRVEIENGSGLKAESDDLIGAIDRDESDVSSYGVSMKLNSAGSLVIKSVKDWGTSMWAIDATLAFRHGKYVVAGYDYNFSYREKHGMCSLNLLNGKAIVNGKSKAFKVPEVSLEKADGLTLLKICQGLGAN